MVRAPAAYAVAPPATNATTPRTKPPIVNHGPSSVRRRWIVNADAPNEVAIKKSMNAMVRARPALEAEVPTLLIISKKRAELLTAITADVIAQNAASAPPPKWRLRYIAAVQNAGTLRIHGIFALASLMPCTLLPQRRRYFEGRGDSCRLWPPS